MPAATTSRSWEAAATFVANVFVLGKRFDSITFNANDPVPTRGDADEMAGRLLRTTRPAIYSQAKLRP